MIVVCGQKIALGRTHAGQTLTTAVLDTTLAIELDQESGSCATPAARNIKADKPRTVPQFPRVSVNHHPA